MKKIAILLLAVVFLLNACSPTNTLQETDEYGSALSGSSVMSEPSVDSTASESNQLMSDEQVFATFLKLYEKAKPIVLWYFSGPDEENTKIKTDSPETHNPYIKFGKFKSIAEMKAATEEVFTQRFSNDLLYKHAFTDSSGNDRPMYKEVDGALFWNTQIGGFGWRYELTDQYTVSLQTDNLIVLLVKSNVINHEEWNTFLMKKENGSWKLEKFYSFSPYMEYEKAIAPAVSAWFCSRNWEDPNEMDANSLLVFYANQFLADKQISDYNVEEGYAVPCDEVFQNLSTCLDGLRMDSITKVKDENYASAFYNEGTDSIVFYLTKDPAAFVICSDKVYEDTTSLHILVIAKSDKASYWGDLTVQPTKEGVRYLSNQHTDIALE